MPDIRRRDALTHGDAPDRESRVDALLVEGLDRYFAGRYEEAIHIWTRVLFLDRSHASARAYIDRARTALAERQRRSDEWLHASQALLAQGRTGDARQLLTQAVRATGDDDRAAALRMRLDRMERTHQAASPVPDSAIHAAGGAIAMSPRETAVWWGLVAATVVAAVWLVVRLVVPAPPVETPASLTWSPTSAQVLDAADTALVRARTLYTRGRLAEALVALDRVGSESARRPAADRLRIDIQRLLLAANTPPSSSLRRPD